MSSDSKDPGFGENAKFLATTELFADMDPSILNEIEPELLNHEFLSGVDVIREGEQGECLYILVRGRLRVHVQRMGEQVIVGEVGPGELVGEMSLLSDESRSATVTTVRRSSLISLSRDAFSRLLDSHPRAMMHITRLIVRRLQATLRGDKARPVLRTIALLPGTQGTPMRAVADRLMGALLPLGRVRIFDESHFAKEHDSSRTLQELDHAEAHFEFVIYLGATTAESSWNQLCIAQADRILVVVNCRENPKTDSVFHSMKRDERGRSIARRDLVIVRAGLAPPVQGSTAPWLEGDQFGTHHHVSLDDPTGFERIARCLAGRSMGLVLGGGGARGLAHIGVLRAFQECGIPIDVIGGASMGAVIAGLFAKSGDASEVERAMRGILTQGKRLKDYTFPMVSVMTGRIFREILMELYGEVFLEDLCTPCFLVSSNLSRAQVMVHRRGPLWRGIRASASLPGILPPVVIEDQQLLVDGGVLNNLPIDVMREDSEGGTVIAVDVGSRVDLLAKKAFPETLSGWSMLSRSMNPFVDSVGAPSIISILLRTTELPSVHAHRYRLGAHQPDIYIRPKVDGFGVMAFREFDKIIEIGYLEAKEKLESWRVDVGN